MGEFSTSLEPALCIFAGILILYRTAMSALLSAFFGLNSLHRRRVLEEGQIHSPVLADLMTHPIRMRLGLTLWTQFLLIVLLTVLLPLSLHLPRNAWPWALVILIYIWAMDLALPVFLTSKKPVVWLNRLFPLFLPGWILVSPIIRSLALRLEHRMSNSDPAPDTNDEAKEEAVTALLEEGTAEGILEEDERELIQKVVDFGETIVREVMTPRTRIIGISSQASLDEAWKAFAQSRHSRLPIFGGSIDHIVGILLLKDLLQVPDGEQLRLLDLAKAPYFIPESKYVSDLFKELQKERLQLAIVVDEFGSVSGLVTLEDLLEEVFGEIQDEHELRADLSEQAPGIYQVQGQIHVEDLSRLLNIDLEKGDFDTVAGMIMARLGRVPENGDSVKLEDAHFTVLEMEGPRIRLVEIRTKLQENHD